jgi:hypothetical protein
MKLSEEIAKVAHELYEKSGWMPGRDFENWLEAERIVRSRHSGGDSGKKNPGVTGEEKPKKTAAAKAKTPAVTDEDPPKKTARAKAKTPSKRTQRS